MKWKVKISNRVDRRAHKKRFEKRFRKVLTLEAVASGDTFSEGKAKGIVITAINITGISEYKRAGSTKTNG
ncbi:hypothetical protein [Endozoicomonas euniceicola]|uniref:30S ribosomal protein S20 n=1 Tax=Endozoicomonas euniceicola TaxID=1234143 RepID=A0ABY6GZM1_9GAMM|nr:hypothetical protein [Endozoicomonas euniceicola]UYM18120.1 hypothetical protein NX720_09500 [Endozoicomonas euniceicola]